MPAHERGHQLRSRDGHFEMATLELKNAGDGCWMWVACDFDGHHGGHWLAPDHAHPDRLAVTTTPYVWPDASSAYAAREQWERQEEARLRGAS